MPVFELEGKRYNVDDKYLEDFSKEFPNATSVFDKNNKRYRVKASDYNAFMQDPVFSDTTTKTGDEEEAKDSYLKDLGEGFMQGVGSLGKIALSPVKKAAEYINESDVGKAINDRLGLEGGQFGQWYDSADKMEKEYAERSDRYGGKDFIQLLKDGKYGDALGEVFLTATKSAPTSLGIMAASAAGSPVAGLALMGSGTASEKYDQLSEENPEMGSGAKIVNSLFTGLFEAGTGYFGTGAAGTAIRQLLKAGGREAAGDAIKKSLMQKSADFMKKHYIVGPMAEEASEEMVNALGEYITDKLTGVDRDDNILETMIKSGVYGAAGGAQYTPLIIGSRIAGNKINNRDVNSNIPSEPSPDLGAVSDQGVNTPPEFTKSRFAEAEEQGRNMTDPGDIRSAHQAMEASRVGLSELDPNLAARIEDYVDDGAGEAQVMSLLDGVDAKVRPMAEDFYADYLRMSGLQDRVVDEVNEEEGSYVANNIAPYTSTAPDGRSIVTTATLNENNEERNVYVRSIEGDNAIISDNGQDRMVSVKRLSDIVESDAVQMEESYRQRLIESREMELDMAMNHNPKTQLPQPGLIVWNGDNAFILQGQDENGDWIAQPAAYDKETGQVTAKAGSSPAMPLTERDILGLQDAMYDAQQASDSVIEQPLADNMIENEAENEVSPPDGQSNMSNNEPAQPEQPGNVDAPVMVIREDGTPDFLASGIDNTLDFLSDKYGEKMPKKIEVTRKAFDEDIKKVSEKLDKAQEAYDNAPIGKEDKAEAALIKARQEYEAIKVEADFWSNLDDDIKEASRKPGDVIAKEISVMGDPMSGEELAAMMLANGSIKLTRDSYKKETGAGNNETGKMFGLFASPSKGGVTIERAGEILELADRENGTGFFDENDPNAGRDAIIEVLSSAQTRGDLIDYVKRNREAIAERERQAEYNAYAEWCEENYHMSPDEYEAYEESVARDFSEKQLTEEEISELDSQIVDEIQAIIDEQNEIEAILAQNKPIDNENVEGNDESGGDGLRKGGGEILPGEQLDQTGRVGEIETREQVGTGIDRTDGAAQEGASGGIKPIGKGFFGNIYDQFKGKVKEAFDFLVNNKEGDLLGVFHRDGIGSIDLVWGNDNGGLKHIIKRHIEEQNDFYDVSEIQSAIDDAISNGDIARENEDKIVLQTDRYKVSINKQYRDENGNVIERKNWVVTAFDKTKKKGEKKNTPSRETLTTPSSNLNKADGVTLPSNGGISTGKGSISSSENQENEAKSFVAPFPKENENPLDYAERVVEAKRLHDEELKVDTNPSEAQKEAGNYKKGHVKINGFNVSIEQPAGSVRSGKDASGKEWSVTMNNTYGYIRGTEGVDGDHIDVFLGPDMNSDMVYVVDQVNTDGSFDEHKVMMGFPSLEDARSAYLSNYEEGWQGLGNITGVTLDEFKKWIDSSTRKTKPFSEYKSVGSIEETSPDSGIRFREVKDDDISAFSKKYNLNEADVIKYARSMNIGNLGGASYAFNSMKRSVRLSNTDLSLGEFVKVFSPIKNELYEKFGSVDALRDEYVRQEMDQRNVMEAARKREEEEAEAERKRLQEFQDMTDDEMDASYLDAMEKNDESRMRDIINESARRKGYISADEFRMSHRAPSYDEEGIDKSMIDVANNKDDIRESLNEQLKMNRDKNRNESSIALNKALDAIDKGENPIVSVYRAVPKSLKEGKVRNGDWVTLSESYAIQHGNHALDGNYRIMKEDVPAENLYWDGNDINEWGYDDKSDYRYKDTRNNRKLNDLITRDDKGNVIPPSKRFNYRKSDPRFRFIGEKGAANLNKAESIESSINDWSTKLNTPVRVIHDVDEITDTDEKLLARKRDSKGWYDTSTGEIVIVSPNSTSVGDAQRTFLHEVVGHHGLRELFGKDFDTFLDNVFRNANEDIRKSIIDRTKGNPLDLREATEEYLAELAESGFDNKAERSLWEKVKDAFIDMLRKAGINLDFKLSDNDLRYILWRSYKNLEQGSLMDVAEDVSMRKKLSIGDYSVYSEGDVMPSDIRGKLDEAKRLEGENEAKKARIEKLRESKPVEITGNEYEGKYKLDRDSAKAWIKDNLRGEYINKDTGDKIEVRKDGAQKVTSHSMGDEAHLKSLSAIPNLIENSIFIDEILNEKDNGKYDSYRYYVCGLKIGEVDYTVKVTVGVKGASKYYDHALTEIEKGNLIDNIDALSTTFDNNKNALSTIKDTKLLSILQTNEQKIYDTTGWRKDGNGNWVYDKNNLNDYNHGSNERDIEPEKGKQPSETKGTGRELESIEGVDESGNEDQRDRIGKPGGVENSIDGTENATDRNGRETDGQVDNDGDQLGGGDTVDRTTGINGVPGEERGDSVSQPDDSDQGRGDRGVEETDRGAGGESRDVDTIGDRTDDFAFAERTIRFREEAREESVLFGDQDIQVVEKQVGAAKDQYERTLSTSSYQSQEAIQDSMLGLKVLQEAVAKANGSRILDYENAYMAENALSSVNEAEFNAYRKAAFEPILKAMSRLEKMGSTHDEINDYLITRHGIERNREMAVKRSLSQNEETYKSMLDEYISRRNEIRDNGKSWEDQQSEMDRLAEEYGANPYEDFSGLTAMYPNVDNTGYDPESAKGFILDYESRYDTSELSASVKRATDAILAKQRDSGLMSQKTFETISDMYQFYVPLRGWEETTADEVYAYLTSESQTFNAPIKTVVGRKSKADDPIATIANMAESGIMQGNRNLMKQKFLTMVQNHKTDLVSVSDMWVRFDETSGEWIAVFPDIPSNATPEQVEAIVEAFNKRMEELSNEKGSNVRRSRDAIGVPYKILPKDLKEHQVIVKRAGKEYVLTINGNPRAAQALNGLTNPDNTKGWFGAVERYAGWLNRNLAANFTTRNPNFMASNFLRDAIYSNTSVWVKESPAYAWRFNMNFAKVNPINMYRLVKGYENGTLDMSDPLNKAYHDFVMRGGETGYTNLRDVEAQKKSIRKELQYSKRRVSIGKALNVLGKWMDLFNKSVENCARFSAFLTSREMGRSMDKSIYDAKEISVNFNKKGSGAKFLGAEGQTRIGNMGAFISGSGRSMYVFWNAGVQGMYNFGRLAKNNPKKFLGLASSFYLLGTIIPMIAAAFGEDDEDDYYDLPEYVRRSNICFRNGSGDWITIPLPIELRAIYGLGEMAMGVISGKERYTDRKLAMKVAEQVSQVLPLDMLEGGGGFSVFVPSSVKPIYEAGVNTDWTGLPLYKDNDFNKGMPEWTKAFKSVDPSILAMTKYANELTGGDKYTTGSVNINPARIEHILEGYFGGIEATRAQLVKSAETAFGERDFDWRNIPVGSRIIKSGDERTKKKAIDNEYYENLDEMGKITQRLRGYEKELDDPKNDDFEIAKYQKLLNELEDSKEYERYEVFMDLNSELKSMMDDFKESGDEELEKEMYELKAMMNEITRGK